MEQRRIVTSTRRYTAVLRCHSDSHSEVVRGIEARISWTGRRGLAVAYTLEGDIKRLSIPPLCAPRGADCLWQHTCFEAFVSVKDKPEYCEFNFSPSGEWSAYGFRRYRAGAPLEDGQLAPKITARITDDHLDLHATIQLHCLPMMPHDACLRLGLSAVVEEENGILSYWALKHAPGKPDFHHPDCFVLEIERPAWNDP